MIESQLADGPNTGPTSEAGAAPVASRPDTDFFWQNGYLHLPGLIPPALVRFLRQYAFLRLATQQMKIGDSQVVGTPVAYADPAFEALLEFVRPRVAEASGRRLHPTYAFFRIYKRGDILARHKDRKSCEISVTVNIHQSPGPAWPIFIEGAKGVHEAVTPPGDGVMYQGHDRHHWREPFEGERMIQAFLHYVDADGPYAGFRFDGRKALMTVKPPRKPIATLSDA